MAGNAGAPRASPNIFSFNCPSCGAAVPVRAPSLSVAASCAQCGAVIDVQSEGYRILSEAAGKEKIAPLIELGSKGKLRGHVWQAIGFMRRHEPGYEDEWWDEYLLFNPYFGFRWLTRTFDEHWNFVRTIKERPEAMGPRLQFHGESYSTFHVGTAEVAYVVGEFYWQVEAGEKAAILDAISPPRMLSRERTDEEDIWSLAEYLRAEEVAGAFGLKALPPPFGLGANQPSPVGRFSFGRWAFAYAAAILGLIAVQALTAALRPEINLFATTLENSDLAAIAGPPAVESKIGSFSVAGRQSAIQLAAHAALSNAYLGLGLRMVNDATGESHEFQRELSSYSGYDEDGSWTEGDPSSRLVASAVAPGAYSVLLTVAMEPSKPARLKIEATQNPLLWSNFWLAAMALLVPPLLFGAISYSYESRRWSQSEYDPFPHAQE